MPVRKQIAILGAGIAGISASFHGKKAGFDTTAYEASPVPGGLLDNFVIDGFRFDNAVHLSFTQDAYVRSLFDEVPHWKHNPDAFCYEAGRWLKHPVQNNLAPLPKDEKVELLESFVDRPDIEPCNYQEWLVSQYGERIAARYPMRYTNKYWGLDAKELSLDWIGNRVRKASFKEVLGGALEQGDENHYYTKEMRYPKQGGYRSFIEKMISEADIACNKKAVEVDLVMKTVTFSDDSTIAYEKLISSLPLPVVVRLIKDCPAEVVDAAESLLFTSVDLVSVGFSKEHVPPYLWFYLYDEDNVAARAYSPSIKSPKNAPEGTSSLQFEIYNLSTKPRLDGEELIANIREKLIEMNVCSSGDILFMNHKCLPYGNVVFDHGMESRRTIVLEYLLSNNISSCGRFGEWDYLWSDQSLLSGRRSIESL